MQSQNTEVGIGYLLKINEMKITPNGIEYYFDPFQKTVLVSCLENISTKDLVFSTACIRPYQKSILLPTNLNHPKVYESQLRNGEKKLDQLYKKGDFFAEIIQILNQ